LGIIEDLGQYRRIVGAGLNFVFWPFVDVAGVLSLRIQQLDVLCETKTKDNVFVQVAVAVQYRVIAEKAYDAYYRLSDPRGQIQSYVFDVIRSTVPRMELDDAFASKGDIADAVKAQLKDVMEDYGYAILQTLVTDINPDQKVKASMNEINAAKRLKEAASHKAEADKIKQVKNAEAEAEARYLSGLGVARQRRAIVQGLQNCVSEFTDDVKDIEAKEVMDVLLLTQYMDTIQAVGANSLILEHNPSVVSSLQASLSHAKSNLPKNILDQAKAVKDSRSGV